MLAKNMQCLKQFTVQHPDGTRGKAKYADPCSMLRAGVMLLSHIGRQNLADKLEHALDICMYEEKKLVITGRADGCTGKEFGDYVLNTVSKL